MQNHSPSAPPLKSFKQIQKAWFHSGLSVSTRIKSLCARDTEDVTTQILFGKGRGRAGGLVLGSWYHREEKSGWRSGKIPLICFTNLSSSNTEFQVYTSQSEGECISDGGPRFPYLERYQLLCLSSAADNHVSVSISTQPCTTSARVLPQIREEEMDLLHLRENLRA